MKIKCIIMFFIGLACSKAFAQGYPYMQNVDGKTITIGQYENISGSPYLLEQWSKGIVKFADGQIYQVKKIKYDQILDQLLFENDKGETMSFLKPIREFEIESVVDGKVVYRKFRNGFLPLQGSTQQSFYEILVDGKLTLLKRSFKVIREEKTYNSATINKNIVEASNYFISKEADIRKINKSRNDFIASFGNKQKELTDYININKVNLKSDKGLSQVVNYYNTL